LQIPKLALLLAVAELITPLLGLAQSSAIKNEIGSTESRAATPVNDSVVSVEELKMSGKAEPAFRKGADLLLKGDARDSLAYFERALEEDPGYYRAYHNLGLAQYQLGEKERAEEAFQRAIDLTNGGFAPSQFGLAMILFEREQFSQAEALIQRGLDMEPGSALGKYLFRGAVCLEPPSRRGKERARCAVAERRSSRGSYLAGENSRTSRRPIRRPGRCCRLPQTLSPRCPRERSECAAAASSGGD
jgi:Tfp pilus assembly protein PilF